MGQWLLQSVMGEGRTGGRLQGPDVQAPERDGNLISKYLTGNTQRDKDPALYHGSMPSPQTED